MSKNCFSSLRDLITTTQDDNWEQELSPEQFFALILSYNEKLSGKKKREENKLVESEMTALELAFKSGFSGSFSEEDITNKIKDLCCEEVREILEEQTSRKQTLNRLHNLATEKRIEELSKYSAESIKEVQRVATSNEDELSNDSYEQNCHDLDFIAGLIMDSNKTRTFAENTGISLDKAKANMQTFSQTCLEKNYFCILERVKCAVNFDALNHVTANEREELQVV